jgi:hypothetical protein
MEQRNKESTLHRRRLLGGVGTVGALAATAAVLPSKREPAEATVAQATPDRGGGYQVTEHVLRYYQTAKV